MFQLPSIRLFSLFKVDVFISVSYVILVALCMMFYGFAFGAIAALAITLSIVIHEFGHAFMCKRYGLSPSILLQAFGGLCFHVPARTDRQEALIAAAGPLLQILVGGIVLGVLAITQSDFEITGGVVSSQLTGILALFGMIFAWFSIFWGLVNMLLPIWPLDGGKLFMLLLRRFMDEEAAQVWTLRVSLALLIPIGAYALWSRQFVLGFITLSIFMQDLQILQSGMPLMTHASGRLDRTKRVKKLNPFQLELFEGAHRAYDEGDWREAARLMHQLRALNTPIPDKKMGEVWTLLGLATLKMNEPKEALGWLERAPQTPEVKEAIAQCKSADSF